MSDNTESLSALHSLPAHLTLLLTWAVLLAAAFPYPGWWPLAHVGLVPAVWLAIRADSIWRLAWTAYLVSFLWWLYMLRWLIPVTGGGYAGLAAYLALYLVAALVLTGWFHRRFGVPLVLLVPLLWVSLELVRGYVLAGGFGWYTLAHSQAPWREDQAPGQLIQCADLFGEQCVSFLVAMTNGVLADLLNLWWLNRHTDQARTQDSQGAANWKGRPHVTRLHARPNVALLVLAWLVPHSGAHLYGHYHLSGVPDVTETVRIAVIQTNVGQDNKERPTKESERVVWDQIERLTYLAGQTKPSVDLIVWPESSTPTYINADAVRIFRVEAQTWGRITPELLTELQNAAVYPRMARELGIDLVQLPAFQTERYNRLAGYADKVAQLVRTVGVPVMVGSLTKIYADPLQRYNSAYLYRADGVQSPSRYDKCHLVPFGEHVPWVENWPWLKNQFIKYLTPYEFDYTIDRGSKLTVFELQLASHVGPDPDTNMAVVHFATPICFEDTDPRLIRRMIYAGGRKRAQLLVNISNDGWFAGSVQGYQHMQAASLRCVENRVPMARSVNTGPSGFVDAVGRIGPLVSVDGRQQLVDGVLAHDVRLTSRRSLFGLWGHTPMVVVLVAICALTIVRPMFRRNTYGPPRG